MSDFLSDKDNLLPCNSTLVDLVQSAIGLGQAVAAGCCQYSSNSTLVSEAKDVWIEASAYGCPSLLPILQSATGRLTHLIIACIDVPSGGFAIFALVAFAISTVIHVYQLWRSRCWTYLAVLAASALQLFGWNQRYYGSQELQLG